MNPTQTLCERLQAIAFASLPTETITRSQELVLDGLAVAVAGSTEPAARILAQHVIEQGGNASSTLIGADEKVPPVAAAYVNGAAMHVLDYEPMWSPANHQLSTTLPVVLALAERDGIAGDEAITALVKGIEVQGLIRAASGQFEPRALRFHPPGLTGPIGAAVAAAHLLGLDAALLAGRGFTANPDIVEVPLGYKAAFFDDGFDTDALLDVRRPYRVVDPGYAIKLYPSQYATHFAITAGLAIKARLEDAAEIASATLVAPVMPYIDKPAPRSGLEGKFSLQYITAAALLDGRVTRASFADARRFASDMEALLPRVKLVQQEGIAANFEAMHVELEVETTGGAKLEARCDGPPGPWGAEPVTPEMHLLKVRDCLGRLGPGKSERCIETVGRLARLRGAEIAKLMELLR